MEPQVTADITIRPACDSDSKCMAALMTELGYPTTTEEMAARLRSVIPHDDYKTLLALVKGEVAGMIGLSKHFYFEKNGSYIRIVALVVFNNFRKCGVGKRLLQEAENWALQLTAGFVLLNSGDREERKPAHRFYERYGYEQQSLGFVKKISNG